MHNLSAVLAVGRCLSVCLSVCLSHYVSKRPENEDNRIFLIEIGICHLADQWPMLSSAFLPQMIANLDISCIIMYNKTTFLCLSYTNWLSGEPNFGSPASESCMHLWSGYSYTWNDNTCSCAASPFVLSANLIYSHWCKVFYRVTL